MMLLFAPHSAEKFTAPISGLRSLLVVPDAGTRGGCVVTRAAVVAAHGCGVCGHREDVRDERRDDGRSSLGQCEDVVETAKEEEEEAENGNAEVKEREEEDELDGFWVSYGRRCPRRRRLPPPIPSLVARGALRRTRTDDGRLVIRIVPVVRPECIHPRRHRRDRLAVVEHEDDSPVMPPPSSSPLREPTTTAAREDGIIRINVAHRADDDNDAATPPPAAGDGVRHVEDAVAAAPVETTLPAAVVPPRVPSVGCFEEVFKLGSIGSSSLHQMPSLRMVH